MTDLGHRWNKLRGLAGLDDVRIHDCRHSFASHAVMSGRDLYTVGRLLGPGAIAAAKPRAAEYTLWDDAIAHFGVRVHPSGVKSFIVQTRVAGRIRKLTLGHYPEMGIEKARREAATSGAGAGGSRPRSRPTTST